MVTLTINSQFYQKSFKPVSMENIGGGTFSLVYMDMVVKNCFALTDILKPIIVEIKRSLQYGFGLYIQNTDEEEERRKFKN